MREVFNMNIGWKFHFGDIEEQNFNAVHKQFSNKPQWLKAGNNGLSLWGYDDTGWEDINLPHDLVNDRNEFSAEFTARQGCLVTGKAWYRKSFEVPKEDKGRVITIEFDGIFRDSTIWFNGHFIGRNLSGYTSFSFDLSDFIHYGGVNTIAVFVNPTEYEGWWYEGGGIYRDVRLVKTDLLHIPQWGTFVKSDIVSSNEEKTAYLTIETTVSNQAERSEEFELKTQIFDLDGAFITEVTSSNRAESHGEVVVVQTASIEGPRLWSIEDPFLYQARSLLLSSGEVVDTFDTSFGVRTIRFDPSEGFFLNDLPIKLQGVCCHEDHAGVGTALPASLHEYRIRRLKEMGCNAYRSSHNHPSPAILEACDKLGMLVVDETRLMSSAEEYQDQLKSLILRDRNHPSVILWSLGNEEMVIQGTPVGVNILKRLQHFSHKLDSTRKCTYAMNGAWDQYTDFHEEEGFTLDVKGFNYNLLRNWESYDRFHEKYPDHPFFGSENASTLATRGLYSDENEENSLNFSQQGSEVCVWSNQNRKGIVSAYGETYPVWGSTPDETWKLVAERPFVAGAFIWTGFDYRGETFPYEWPSVIARYGIMDLCGFAKDHFYYYKAWWTNEAVLHIFPHWNWQGKEGEIIDVGVYSNMDEVELLLNGESYGRQSVPKYGHLRWEIPYHPGKLVAKGFKEGNEVKVRELETTEEPTQLVMVPQKIDLFADNEDVCVINVQLEDKCGRMVPNQDREIIFSIQGEGKIIGTGNGNPLSHEDDKASHRRTYHGLCQIIVQSTDRPGEMIVTAASDGMEISVARVSSHAPQKAMPVIESKNLHSSEKVEVGPRDAADGGI